MDWIEKSPFRKGGKLCLDNSVSSINKQPDELDAAFRRHYDVDGIEIATRHAPGRLFTAVNSH